MSTPSVSRADANVWAPFYEMPWARSGKGIASDGLSKFDLTRFNPWYYERIREFGDSATPRPRLYHNLYNTHNVLEIPPHWVDYPWRPANNVNNTGLPEPPPIEPGKHIHLANEVYDSRNPVRREIHRALMLHELDELRRPHNLFFSLGAQFAGPLEFQEFFQDTVAEWEKKTGRTVRMRTGDQQGHHRRHPGHPGARAAGRGDRHALLAIPAGWHAVGAAGRQEPGVP